MMWGRKHSKSGSKQISATGRVHRGTAVLGWLQGSVVLLAGESLPSLFRTDVRATSIT
jgi:hypothetical protein